MVLEWWLRSSWTDMLGSAAWNAKMVMLSVCDVVRQSRILMRVMHATSLAVEHPELAKKRFGIGTKSVFRP